eukprot:350077-Chlamydomonas_euryale.AAC.9
METWAADSPPPSFAPPRARTCRLTMPVQGCNTRTVQRAVQQAPRGGPTMTNDRHRSAARRHASWLHGGFGCIELYLDPLLFALHTSVLTGIVRSYCLGALKLPAGWLKVGCGAEFLCDKN